VFAQVVTTLSRGKVVWDQGKLFTKVGDGRFVPLPPFGPLFTGLDRQDATNAKSPYGETPVRRDYGHARKQEL
jgi:dihydropyrimidinase